MNAISEAVCGHFNLNSTCVVETLNWFVSYTDVQKTWENEPTFLFIQAGVLIGVILNYIHACRHGGQYYHFWWSTVVVSIVTEMVCYQFPNLNNFWHAQGFLIFAGRRFPLYIVLIYNHFWYTAFVVVSRARLAWWAQPFAIGLLTVLIDLPYDIMGAKMVWWTWHDTDANLFDRSYYVPWTSYYFHSAFSAALYIVFFVSKKILMRSKGQWDTGNCVLEWFCTVLAGVLAMPIGSLAFITIFYNVLHDRFGVHSEVPVLMWLCTLGMIVWCADRRPAPGARKIGGLISLPLINIVQHFTFFFVLMFFAKPEEVRSTGLHQAVGSCDVTEETFTLSGMTILRKKNLCLDNYDEPFDFRCLPDGKPPANGSEWYTVCGQPYENPMEYRFIVWFSCLLGLFVFVQLLVFSGDEPVSSKAEVSPENSNRSRTKKSKRKHERPHYD